MAAAGPPLAVSSAPPVASGAEAHELWQNALNAGVDPFDKGSDPTKVLVPTFGKAFTDPRVAQKLVVMCWNLKIQVSGIITLHLC